MNISQIGAEVQEQVVKEMTENGKLPKVDFSEDAVIKEMIGTDDGSREFIEKVTYDAYTGRENVPLLYKSIYSTQTDSNFPKTFTVKEFGPVQTVFLRKLEGGEVKFGALGSGPEKTVTFETWAAGIEYDEDIVEWNQTWRVADIGVSFGESYNKLLNHLHLSPIIGGSYVTTGGGLAAQKAKQESVDDGAAQLIAFNTDIKTTLRDALQVLPRGSVVLHNSFDTFAIQDALASDLLTDNSAGPVKKALSNAQFIAYDGETVEVGGKTYEYDGVAQGFIYLVVPKTNFKEYIKHDLRVDSDDGDLSRLVLAQVVGRARRAVLAGLSGAFGAIKVDISNS
jgi:hypothetical protein